MYLLFALTTEIHFLPSVHLFAFNGIPLSVSLVTFVSGAADLYRVHICMPPRACKFVPAVY